MRGWWIALALVLCIPLAHALAVSYDYLDQDTLELPPGGTYYYKLVLQNEDPEPITITVLVESPIATLIGPTELTLPPRTFSTSVYLNITVPADAPADTAIPVRFIVAPVPGPGDGGQVPFSVKYDRSVTVRVTPGATAPVQSVPIPALPAPVEEPLTPEPRPLLAAVLIGAGLLAIIIIGLIARRPRRRAPRA